MSDDIEAIRQARLQELKASGSQQPRDQDKQKSQEDEARVSLLSQVLSTEARERLSRIRMVREDRARGIEDLVLRMAKSGQIQRKVSEQELVSLLDQISQQENSHKTKIVFERRNDDFENPLLGSSFSSSKPNETEDDEEDDFFD